MPLSALLITEESEQRRLLGADFAAVQLQRALGVGATHAVILSKRTGAALVDVMDGLRRHGMSVDHARTPADAADFIHPDDRVLVMPEALTIAPDPLARLASASAPHILCVEEHADNRHFELIDSGARWTGAAMVSGELVRTTAAMVGDWDFASVLLRSAVQGHATRTVLSLAEQADALLAIGTSDAAIEAGRRLIGQTHAEPDGAGTHWLVDPAVRLFAQLASNLKITAENIAIAGFIVFGFGLILTFMGWATSSAILALLGLMVAETASILGRAATGLPPFRRIARGLVTGMTVLIMLGFAIILMRQSQQWGCVVLVLVALGATWLAAPFARNDQSFGKVRADNPAYLLLMSVCSLIGWPIAGLSLAALYGVATLVYALRYNGQERLAAS